MASRLAQTMITMRRPSSCLRSSLAGAMTTMTESSQPRRQHCYLSMNINNGRMANSLMIGSRSMSSTDGSLRRRRKRGSKAATTPANTSTSEDPSTSTTSSTASSAFAPVDSSGELLDAQSYLSLASLSPWVPCPDMVVKRALEIADLSAGEDGDVHCDLGCGDGRLNFAAADLGVTKSWGVDVDKNVLDRCRERLGRRFVPSNGGLMGGMPNNISQPSVDAEQQLEFVQADLIQVVEKQKEIYQQRQKQEINSQDVNIAGDEDCNITSKLSQSTVVTMYFVDDALKQIRPYLAATLGGKENVRVVTVGYEMKGGWEPSWVERVLGLTIFKYDMKDVSNHPAEWTVVGGEGGEDATGVSKSAAESNKDVNNGFDALGSDDFSDVDESNSKLAEYLQQKREQDMEDLNEGLRIHHDEALNDFAQHRNNSSKPNSSNNINHNNPDSSSPSMDISPLLVEDDDDDDWDFDETEDPEVLMEEAQRIMAEMRMAARGKGLTAGLDVEKTKGNGIGKGGGGKGTKGVAASGGGSKPVWKKP